MDPVLDPPPLPDLSTGAAVPPAANPIPIPAPAPALNHPPYAEMITAAITALNERDGSSKRAISKYIETHYSGLPPTHDALLTHHLKRLKATAHLSMVKHSYVLPRSAPLNGAVTPDPSSAVPKRRPGRPPKSKPDAVQAAVPVFAPPPAAAVNVAVGPVNGPVRGRGRPPKRSVLKRGPGRPPKAGGPPKVAPPPAAAAAARKGTGRPRGRPPKPINVVAEAPAAVGLGIPRAPAAVTGGKRRGRPPKAGNEAKRLRSVSAVVQPRKPRKLSGKPLGRPKKNASATATATSSLNRAPDSQLLVAYLDLKAKLENLQSRVRQTANFIRPSLNNDAAINALQDLELIAMTVSMPAPAQAPQPQPQPEQYHQLQQPQPQPQPEI